MFGFIVFLLIVWLALSVFGFMVEGLLWLAIIGIALFVATGIWGWFQRAGSRS